MTEELWLASSDPRPMIEFLRDGNADRKMRLFAVACFRKLLTRIYPHLLPEALACSAVAERYADGLAVRAELLEMSSKTSSKDYGAAAAGAACILDTNTAARSAAYCGQKFASIAWVKAHPGHRQNSRGGQDAKAAESLAQSALFRCIFGNPFRPIELDPSWLTSTVTALARGIYDDRAFDRLPILADALQDAGCDNADVLNHCRDTGPHARGCWVVDLLLGKA